MKIELKGVEFSNKGAELMLHSILQQLKQYVPQAQVVLTPGHLLPYQKRAVLGTWQKLSFRLFGIDWTFVGNWLPQPLKRLMAHFGIVVEKDIDLVLDASGFIYSDQWEVARLEYCLAHLERIAKYKQNYIFLPQAFGPFNKARHSKFMAKIINKATWVIARDQVSLMALEQVNQTLPISKANLACYPDMTTILDVSDVELSVELPSKFVTIVPNSKMYGGKSAEVKQQYIHFIQTVIEHIESLGLVPVLLNHEGEKDHQLCQQVIALCSKPPQYINGIGALEVKKVLGMAQFNVSSRFHGCVSSLSQGVPTLATSWGHKYEQLFEQYDCVDNILDIAERDALLIKLNDLHQLTTQQRNELTAKANQQKQKVTDMWQQLFDKLATNN